MQRIAKSLKALSGKARWYTVQSLREKGMLRTAGMWMQWIVSRARFFTYEPVRKLHPIVPSPIFDRDDSRSRIAVQIHMYYLDLLDEMIDFTNLIPYRFDCYISTDSKDKADMIRQRFARDSKARRTEVRCFENVGRDVAPLILQMSPIISDYDYILHLHTKYSAHDHFGNQWRAHLLNSLLASEGHIAALLGIMEEDHRIGIIFQRTYWRVKPSLGWKGNKTTSKALFTRMGLKDIRLKEPQFPAGNMFWARTRAVLPLFRCDLTVEDFEHEAQQVDGTLAHSIERCWGYIAASQEYSYLRVSKGS